MGEVPEISKVLAPSRLVKLPGQELRGSLQLLYMAQRPDNSPELKFRGQILLPIRKSSLTSSDFALPEVTIQINGSEEDYHRYRPRVCAIAS